MGSLGSELQGAVHRHHINILILQL